MTVYLTASVSGAHFNPAVTVALCLFDNFRGRKVVLVHSGAMVIMVLTDDGNGVPRGLLALLLIGLLVAVIGSAMGPLTGFALNPARDFGPKLFALCRLG